MTDRLDTLGMFDLAAALPEQVAEAVERASAATDLPDRAGIDHVVVLGMGGGGGRAGFASPRPPRPRRYRPRRRPWDGRQRCRRRRAGRRRRAVHASAR